MDSKILLGRIIKKLIDQHYSQFADYNRFDFVELKKTSIVVKRENGGNAFLSFNVLLTAIDVYQANTEKYDKGPSELRTDGITHVTSPIFSLLHLLPKESYS